MSNGENLTFVTIAAGDPRLDQFLAAAGDSLKTFRYFKNRPQSVLKNHLLTLLGLSGGRPVCYGHLDPEGGIVWLGICVIEPEKGKGLGQRMMRELLAFADAQRLARIDLEVNVENRAARRLYEDFGFEPCEADDKKVHYKREGNTGS